MLLILFLTYGHETRDDETLSNGRYFIRDWTPCFQVWNRHVDCDSCDYLTGRVNNCNCAT